MCGATERRLDWALIPGRGTASFRDGDRLLPGSRSIEDYVSLCCTCHSLYGRDGSRPCFGLVGVAVG